MDHRTSTAKVGSKTCEKMGLNSSLIFPLMGLFLFFELLLLCAAQGQIHSYEFVLEEKEVTRLCENKTILTVNGEYPGPVIRVQMGDRVLVNIKNNGSYGVTIHWHGVKQPRNPWSDGPEYITQCPIQPQSSFTQEIIFSDEIGTLWWHAHSDWTRTTVHGAIVISPPPGSQMPYPKPTDEEIIILGEWYKVDEHEELEKNLANCSYELPLSDGYTINGQLGDTYDCSTDGMYQLNVTSGKTYLLRIINAIMNEQMFFGIANHSLKIVGMDGAYVNQITRDFVMIASGQTMDVLVTANQVPDDYYMVGSPYADTVAPENKENITTAILHYNGDYTPSDPPYVPELPYYNDSNAALNFTMSLRSYSYPVGIPHIVNRRIFMTISANQIECPYTSTGSTGSASMNNISFAFPSNAYILEAYDSERNDIYNKTYPPRRPNSSVNYTGSFNTSEIFTKKETPVIMLRYGDAVEIIFQGTNMGAAESHPMHLHGFSFYVVGMGLGNFHKDNATNYNLRNPPYLNTFALPKNGWATIRFIANNPGVWFMHCHLERHATQGMDTVFIVKDGKHAGENMFPRPDDMPSCLSSSY